MLSCSVGSLRNRFPFAPPGRVGGRKGFCSRAIPGPGLSQNPALCGSPPTKCSSALALYWCEGGIPLGRSVLREYPATSTHSRFGQRGPGRAVPSLSSLPCWVVPPPKTRQSVEPPASSLSSPLRGTASPCLSLPAIPPHLRRGEPRRKCSGRAGGSRSQLNNCFRLLAQRMSGGAFGGLWPPRLIALSAHNHAFASARHPLRRWVPFSLGFAHGRYPFDSALSRAVPARTPEAVCTHRLPVFVGGREPRVSRPLYRQSPSFLTR